MGACTISHRKEYLVVAAAFVTIISCCVLILYDPDTFCALIQTRPLRPDATEEASEFRPESMFVIVPAPDMDAELPPSDLVLPKVFEFKDGEASLQFSLMQYEAQRLNQEEPDHHNGGHAVLENGQTDHRIFFSPTHDRSVFRTDKKALFFAAFNPGSNGCLVKALDLSTGATLWQTCLRAVGLVEHHAYDNKVTIDLSGTCVIITGRESYGDYIEILDKESGALVAHKIYRKAFAKY